MTNQKGNKATIIQNSKRTRVGGTWTMDCRSDQSDSEHRIGSDWIASW